MKTVQLAFLATVLNVSVHAQDMLKALRYEHNHYRFGIGLQASEPSGLILQFYRGYFCSNDDTYATKLVWEVTGGMENLIFQRGEKYRDGKWTNGGIQGSFGFHYPVTTLLGRGFTFQWYFGAAAQGGTRQYVLPQSDETLLKTVFGANATSHFSIMGRGIEIGDGIWFLTIQAGAKFHYEPSADFYFIRPNVGIVMRKSR